LQCLCSRALLLLVVGCLILLPPLQDHIFDLTLKLPFFTCGQPYWEAFLLGGAGIEHAQRARNQARACVEAQLNLCKQCPAEADNFRWVAANILVV
jgi:hypothetical protein